jgi:hypothetical protein
MADGEWQMVGAKAIRHPQSAEGLTYDGENS